MKKCPKCNKSYDGDINFCLIDGETLYFPIDSEPTVMMNPSVNVPPPNYGPPPPAKKTGLILGFIAVGLLFLIIGAGLVVLLRPEVVFPVKGDSNSADNKANQTSVLSGNSPNDALNAGPMAEPPRPPVSSPTRGLKRYEGVIGGQSASFDLVWNNDNSVVGNYFLNNNANLVYTVQGTNYTQGRVNLSIFEGSRQIGQMQLYKTLEGRILCWQGDLNDTSRKSVRFCRNR